MTGGPESDSGCDRDDDQPEHSAQDRREDQHIAAADQVVDTGESAEVGEQVAVHHRRDGHGDEEHHDDCRRERRQSKKNQRIADCHWPPVANSARPSTDSASKATTTTAQPNGTIAGMVPMSSPR